MIIFFQSFKNINIATKNKRNCLSTKFNQIRFKKKKTKNKSTQVVYHIHILNNILRVHVCLYHQLSLLEFFSFFFCFLYIYIVNWIRLNLIILSLKKKKKNNEKINKQILFISLGIIHIYDPNDMNNYYHFEI